MGNAQATLTRDAPQRRVHRTHGAQAVFLAARALDDCGVIRARFNAKGYRLLSDLGYATSRPAGNWKADFRLTDAGKLWLAKNRRG